jgi:hypothetical protein
MPKKESKPSQPKTLKKVGKALNAFEQLAPNEQVFVKEYIVDFNATRAAIEMGAKKTSAAVIGCNMLGKPHIGMAIAEAVRPMMEEAELTTAKVLRQLHNFLFYDITPYIDANGHLKCDPDSLPEAIRQSIIGFDGDEKFDRDGNLIHTRLRVRLVNKEGALKLAMQYLKLTEPDTQVNLQQDFFTIFYNQAQEQQGTPSVIVEGKIKPGKELTNGNGKAH